MNKQRFLLGILGLMMIISSSACRSSYDSKCGCPQKSKMVGYK
jgi:hypothetical protein